MTACFVVSMTPGEILAIPREVFGGEQEIVAREKQVDAIRPRQFGSPMAYVADHIEFSR